MTAGSYGTQDVRTKTALSERNVGWRGGANSPIDAISARSTCSLCEADQATESCRSAGVAPYPTSLVAEARYNRFHNHYSAVPILMGAADYKGIEL
ncbi:MAG: hypothetical protein JWN24_939 [Phycisphaerales bacterium]|nr:hypothetical protein [Phycisphaerales bacterium]